MSTLGGFAVWGVLIRRYGAATVAPFSMLVPFFGMGSAVLFLGETLHATDLLAGALVIGGVLYGARSSRTAPVDHELKFLMDGVSSLRSSWSTPKGVTTADVTASREGRPGPPRASDMGF